MKLIDGPLQGLEVVGVDRRRGAEHELRLAGKICTFRQTEGSEYAGEFVGGVSACPARTLVGGIGAQRVLGGTKDIEPLADGLPAAGPERGQQIVQFARYFFGSGV